MRRLIALVSLTLFIFTSESCYAKPIFLIQSTSKTAEPVASQKLKRKPTEFLKDAKANNNSAVFYLPKTVAEIELTYVIYVRNETLESLGPALLPTFEPPKSEEKEKEKEKEKDTNVLASGASSRRPASSGEAFAPRSSNEESSLTAKVPTVDVQESTSQSNVEHKSNGEKIVRYPKAQEKFEVEKVPETCPVVVTLPVPVTVKFFQLPDTDLGFRAELGAMKGLVSDVNKAQITKTANGIISGVDAEVADRTLDIFEDFSVTAINVGKKIMSTGLFRVPLRGLEADLSYKQIGVVKIRKVVEIGNSNADAEENSFKYTISDKKDEEVLINTLKALGFKKTTFAMPRLHWSLNKKLNLGTKSEELISEAGYQGIVVREPDVIDVAIDAEANFLNPKTVYQGRQILAQSGGFAGVRIGKRTFSKAAQQITLSEQGAILTVNKTTTSPLKAISGALRNISAAASP